MKAPPFELPGVDGKRHSPQSVRGDKGLLVMFICNHCPYVKRVIDGVVRDCKALAPLGIGSIAVMSNDPADYPEDSFENMKRFAREKGFPFPYVIDEMFKAMKQIAETGKGPKQQIPAVGCSIKWKK